MEVHYLAEVDLAEKTTQEGVAPNVAPDPSRRTEGEGDPELREDQAGPAQCLKKWLRQQKVPQREIPVVFSCRGVITRVIILPEIGRKDLERLLSEQADQYFTFDLRDYLVDYRVLEHFVDNGEGRLRVLLAALPKQRWEKFWYLCLEAGVKPKVVDLASDSIARLYAETQSFFVREEHNLTDAISSGTEVQAREMTTGGEKTVRPAPERRQTGALIRPAFVLGKKPGRELPDKLVSLIGGRGGGVKGGDSGGVRPDLAIVILRQGCAEMILLEHGVFFLYSDLDVSWPEEGSVPVPQGLEKALGPVLRVLEEFVDFFAARHFGKRVDEIFLTGELSDLPGLAQMFTESLEIPARIGFPVGWQPRFLGKAEPWKKGWMKYADLYGLALRED